VQTIHALSVALRSDYHVRSPDDLAEFRVASVDEITNLYFRDNDDVLRKKFKDAVGAAKQGKVEGERLRRLRAPAVLPAILETVGSDAFFFHFLSLYYTKITKNSAGRVPFSRHKSLFFFLIIFILFTTTYLLCSHVLLSAFPWYHDYVFA